MYLFYDICHLREKGPIYNFLHRDALLSVSPPAHTVAELTSLHRECTLDHQESIELFICMMTSFYNTFFIGLPYFKA